MNNLTAERIDADINILLDGFSSNKRHIPSPLTLLRISILIPFISICLSFFSILLIYLSDKYVEQSFIGYFYYLLSDGWIVILPTLGIGGFFSLMTYNNLTMYEAIPKCLREKSLLIKHLKSVTKRTIYFFIALMLLASILSIYYSRAAFAIPALEFAMFFGISVVIGSEVNRLGAGIALEKISNLIKKI